MAIALLVAAAACSREPVNSSGESTYTMQPSTTGTTATETGGGGPVTSTTVTTATTATTATH